MPYEGSPIYAEVTLTLLALTPYVIAARWEDLAVFGAFGKSPKYDSKCAESCRHPACASDAVRETCS